MEGINANIREPYSESWTLGIQRALTRASVLEVRYNGNRSVHDWTALNYNEVNIFENGFLQDFQRAQANLAASGGANGANPSFAGNNLTILNQAFGAGELIGRS